MQYRIQALVKQSEPDELDVMPQLTSARAWLALLVLAAVMAAALVWSFVGGLQRTLSAPGLLSQPVGLVQVPTPSSGVVQQLLAAPTQPVQAGQAIATIVDASAAPHRVVSPFAGEVVGSSVAEGQPVSAGMTLITLRRSDAPNGPLVARLFVPSKNAAQIAPGMSAQLSLDSAPAVAFGQLRGRVASVDPFPLTPEQTQAVVGNSLLAQRFTAGGPVQLVTVDLTPSTKTLSGYEWTNPQGPPFPLLPQSSLNGSVRLSSQHPINFVFGR